MIVFLTLRRPQPDSPLSSCGLSIFVRPHGNCPEISTLPVNSLLMDPTGAADPLLSLLDPNTHASQILVLAATSKSFRSKAIPKLSKALDVIKIDMKRKARFHRRRISNTDVITSSFPCPLCGFLRDADGAREVVSRCSNPNCALTQCKFELPYCYYPPAESSW